jgi:hypothetical protein
MRDMKRRQLAAMKHFFIAKQLPWRSLLHSPQASFIGLLGTAVPG